MTGERRVPLGDERDPADRVGANAEVGARPDAGGTPERSPAERAREICLRLLEVKPRTAAELAKALRAKGIDTDVTDEVLSRFVDVGLVDDALFARMWVDSRHRGRGIAGHALAQELRRKGVDEQVVRDAVGELGLDEQADTARSLVRRKLATTRGLATEARVRRLVGMLARKGYPASMSYRVVKEELDAEGVETPVLDTDALSALE